MKILWLVALCLAASLEAKPLNKAPTGCFYNSCHPTSSEYLNVHIVPHSHDDVGWLKNVDQYYYGMRTDIQRAGVQYILDSVIAALRDNPERRFIQVETAFFHKWWNEQTPEKQQLVKELVNNGQLEFTGGAWSMNDEAASHYHSLVDQFTFGLTWLNETFGECGRPKIGWQIDPFGHSKEQASIFAHLGYDGFFFARLDWRDKGERLATKTGEMIWKSSKSLGNASNIFTSVLYNHYSAPPGFCFDVLCNDVPIVTEEKSSEYNYEMKIRTFAEFLKRQADRYATNNIIITMGDDFNYQDAHMNFINMDHLIRGFKLFPQTHDGKKMNVFYSTPSCYVKAVHEESMQSQLAFPVKTDDFFPYASDHNSYWSGYFTSRPTSKRFERQSLNFLQVLKQVLSLSTTNAEDEEALFDLNNAVGIMQHHDAITGTEKQHVADDYAKIMDKSIEQATKVVSKKLSNLLEVPNLDLHNCLLSNISVCAQSMGDDFLVLVYNPLSRVVDHHVRLPVDTLDFTIYDGDKNLVEYQIVPSISNFTMLENVMHFAKYDLVFTAKNIPALGMRAFEVRKKETKEYGYQLIEDTSFNRFSIGDNKTIGATINATTGLLNSVTVNGITHQVHQELLYYIGAKGNNIISPNRASGAYIFRPSPKRNETQKFNNETIATRTYRGSICDEIHQNFSSWATQIIRIYKDSNHVEFDWLIGPIPIDDNEGREVISYFKTNMDSGDTFYTDSNGREMVKRRINFRETFNYSNEEPTAGNYYPITSKITIKDDNNARISVINDRAQGGSSLKSGEIELMMHRRLLNDDGFGVSEAINERQYGIGLIARGKHYLVINDLEAEKHVAEENVLTPWVFVSNHTGLLHDYSILSETSTIPGNVRILSLEPKPSSDELLIRLEHFYEKDEDAHWSQTAEVDLSTMFKTFSITSLKETTLGANEWLQQSNRLDWILGEPLSGANYEAEEEIKVNVGENQEKLNDLIVVLQPFQIRTFIAKVRRI